MAQLVGVLIAIVLIVLGVWALTTFWNRKARKVAADHPTAWVRPVARGSVLYLLYLDRESIKLISASGHEYQVHARADLASARVGKVSRGAMSRAALTLEFHDGESLELTGFQRGGFGSSAPLARSAVAYLS